MAVSRRRMKDVVRGYLNEKRQPAPWMGLLEKEDEDYMNRDTTYMIDTSEFSTYRAEFASNVDFDCFAEHIQFVSKAMSTDRILNTIRSVMREEVRVKFNFTDASSAYYYINGEAFDKHNNPLAIMQVYVETDGGKKRFNVEAVMRGHVSVFGDREYVMAVTDAIEDVVGREKIPTVLWHYLADGSHRSTEMTVHSDVEIKDEYYPFIKGGVQKFMQEYLGSRESILILLGPPGTGKSTLLRDTICREGLTASITYEEQLLEKDKLFIQHLSSETSDVLILEDADVLLESREGAGNRIMNKLLNVSDGIIKVVNKKIIFTTNLTSTKNIDDALLRPGRCFGAIPFRNLTFDEAVVAARAAGIEPPTEERSYSLAEMFTGKKSISGDSFKRRVGFR